MSMNDKNDDRHICIIMSDGQVKKKSENKFFICFISNELERDFNPVDSVSALFVCHRQEIIYFIKL